MNGATITTTAAAGVPRTVSTIRVQGVDIVLSYAKVIVFSTLASRVVLCLDGQRRDNDDKEGHHLLDYLDRRIGVVLYRTVCIPDIFTSKHEVSISEIQYQGQNQPALGVFTCACALE